jgi:hypothetical protein
MAASDFRCLSVDPSWEHFLGFGCDYLVGHETDGTKA